MDDILTSNLQNFLDPTEDEEKKEPTIENAVDRARANNSRARIIDTMKARMGIAPETTLEPGSPFTSEAVEDQFRLRMRESDASLRTLNTVLGTPDPIPGTSFGGGVLFGASAELLGEQPRGITGQLGQMTGILGSIIGLTVAFKRGAPAGLTAKLGPLWTEILAGAAADTAYMEATPTEEDPSTYAIMGIANLGLPMIGSFARQFSASMKLGHGVEHGLQQLGITKVGMPIEKGIQENLGESILKDSGVEIKDIPKTGWTPKLPKDFDPVEFKNYKWESQAEVEIANVVQKSTKLRNRYESISQQIDTDIDKVVDGKNIKRIASGKEAIRNEVTNFLSSAGKVSDSEEIMLREMFDRLPKGMLRDKELLNTYNKAFFNESFERVPASARAEGVWGRKINALERRLQIMSENIALGLPMDANKTIRNSQIAKLKSLGQVRLTKIAEDRDVQSLLTGIKTSLTSLVDEPFKSPVSTNFVKTPLFQERFIQSLAFLSRVEDPTLKREAAFEFAAYLERNQAKIERGIRQSISNALRSDPIGISEKNELAKLLRTKAIVKSDDWKNLRPKLSKYITQRLMEDMPTPAFSSSMDDEVKALDNKLAGMKNTTELSGVEAERRVVKQQAVSQLLLDPRQTRQIAEQMGDKDLMDAVDLYYASFNDPLAKANLAARTNMAFNDTSAKIVATNLQSNTRPVYDSHINPSDEISGAGWGKGGDDGTHIGPDTVEDFAARHAIKDLNPVRRLLGTLTAAVDQDFRKAISSTAREFFTGAKQWLDNAFAARNSFLYDLEKFNKEMLDPFYKYVDSIPNNGREAAYNFIDQISKYADNQLALGIPDDEIETAILAQVRNASPSVRQAYTMFRDITDRLYDEINATIYQHNEFIRAGLKQGKYIDPMRKRPGYVPFLYEGDYMLHYVRPDGSRNTIFVFGRKEAYKTIKDLLSNGETSGKIVLEPRYADSAEEVLSMPHSTASIDDLFGRDVADIQDLIGKKKFTEDNIHNVFYGNKLERRLGAEDQRIATQRAIAVASRLGLRFKNYFGVAQEGQTLIRRAKDLNLHNYADAFKVYADDLMGKSRSTEAIIEKQIKNFMEWISDTVPGSSQVMSAFGIGPNSRIIRSVSNGLTLLGRMTALGFNPAAALVQWFIIPTNLAPVIGFKNAAYGLKMLSKMKGTEQFQRMWQKAGLHINPANIGMADRMHLPSGLYSKADKTTQWLDFASMYMFNGSENTIRASALIGARKFGEDLASKLAGGVKPKTWQEGMLRDLAYQHGKKINDPAVLDDFAAKVMRDTNFDFDITGLSELARNPLTKPFAQFKTYFFKEVELLMGKSLPITHKERMLMLGMFSTIGGLFALPFADELDQLSTSIFGVSPRLWVQQNMPEVLSSGVPGFFGVDMSSKASVGQLSRAFSPSGFFGVFPSKVASGYMQYMKGNVGALDAATGTISAVRSFQQGLELMTTGKLSDSYGQTVGTLDEIGYGGAAALSMGLPPVPYTKAKTLADVGRRYEMRQQSRDNAAIRDYLATSDPKERREIAKEAGLSSTQIKNALRQKSLGVKATLQRKFSKKVRTEQDLSRGLEDFQ